MAMMMKTTAPACENQKCQFASQKVIWRMYGTVRSTFSNSNNLRRNGDLKSTVGEGEGDLNIGDGDDDDGDGSSL